MVVSYFQIGLTDRILQRLQHLRFQKPDWRQLTGYEDDVIGSVFQDHEQIDCYEYIELLTILVQNNNEFQQRIEFVKQAHRNSETQLRAQVERLKMELLQEQDKGARAYEAIRSPLSSLVRHAKKVITAEGPMVPLSKLAESLYSSSKPAKDQITAAGGMKRWLQKWPDVFELHGLHEPGFEQASLRNARMRALQKWTSTQPQVLPQHRVLQTMLLNPPVRSPTKSSK